MQNSDQIKQSMAGLLSFQLAAMKEIRSPLDIQIRSQLKAAPMIHVDILQLLYYPDMHNQRSHRIYTHTQTLLCAISDVFTIDLASSRLACMHNFFVEKT